MNRPKHQQQYDPKIAGLYDLGDTLGRGHFAVVKLARHVFTGEQVAVKVIDKTKLDEVSRAHLFQEVRCMKLVQHPNVVRLYEVIDTQTKLYLVLEYGDGGDMYDYIMKHDRGVSEQAARKYFRQIVHAIWYCHKLHVVHRDLKPENVVFFEKLEMVKLTDFGFSNKFCPGQKLETSCGSLAYSAPEILLGDSYDAPKVDVWSLGVILYMLVCGHAPFQEANDSETLTMIMDCKYTIPPHVSDDCKRMIARMLIRDPDKRASLEEIAADPWLATGDAPQPADHLPLIHREHLSEEDHSHIIQKMVNGCIASKDEILEALDRNEYNYMTATYYLLAERKLRAQRQEKAQQLNRTSRADLSPIAVTPGLITLRDPSGHLARSALRLQEFDFIIAYKSGWRHTDTNCLSRLPLSTTDDNTDTFDVCFATVQCAFPDVTTFQREQRNDLTLDFLFAPVRSPKGSGRFCLRDGLLYKMNFSANGAQYFLVVPQSLRYDVLHFMHDDPTSGHLGFIRTFHRTQDCFYWPKMGQCTKQYVSSCDKCQHHKRPTSSPHGLLHPITPPTTPFEQVGIDLLGPFPWSCNNNRWIIVCVDHLTRYAETAAIPSSTADSVASFLLRSIVLRHGPPRVIISDRGRQFVADAVEELLRLCTSQFRHSTPYHPQTNGLVERTNHTLTNMLAMYVSSNHRNWDDILHSSPTLIIQRSTNPWTSLRSTYSTLDHRAAASIQYFYSSSIQTIQLLQRCADLKKPAESPILTHWHRKIAPRRGMINATTPFHSKKGTSCGCGPLSGNVAYARNL
ncbi:SNF related kinase isoform X1 [Rhipicephalus microplus]|uniref:SNF related kinase isoform X1 n=1 Tax=Rhipicephalus microplus TaxID=6941 RepID=UPI003F6BB1BF